jgi:hypothetical protein
MKVSGQILKMTHELCDPIKYYLSLDEKPYPLTDRVGKDLTMKFSGLITCVECGRKIKKTYNDGYCFPCARDLPENAMCSVRPETCAHEFGNEQDREFFRTYCNVDHYVYLSLTSGVKVGVTRHYNVPSRWIDQGAVQALVIARTPQRVLAGKIEVALAKNMPDKTNWRKMLKGDIADVDLLEMREKVFQWIPDDLRMYFLKDEKAQTFAYPIIDCPEKITSRDLEKEVEINDNLRGIKGQYLIFRNGVLNMRKYSGFHVEFTIDD